MPRLRNAKSGVVVSVDEERAEQLGAEWSPAEAKPTKSDESAKKGKPKTG